MRRNRKDGGRIGEEKGASLERGQIEDVSNKRDLIILQNVSVQGLIPKSI